MIPKKYEESNSLTAQRKSLPSFIQQQIIISDSEIELAKQCLLYLIQQLRDNHNQVWIPYGEILGEALKAEKGTDSRGNKENILLPQCYTLSKGRPEAKTSD